ncbi:MAG: aminoacyl-tRNA hydrolase [Candidatus Omnitrophica bacterium]|nr:aminoacyl-tRNA hydrolase [Candidatus Omnitrophota bacterium]MCM8828445.1 aminoacyl-tRNA hydrolase [Candidatus Omnitrophota bacterium]
MVILGLGNPGKKYCNNRHNIGARVAEELLKRPASINQKWRCRHFLANEIEISSGYAIVAVPRTFMNESGKAALGICKKFNIKPGELFVIYDDVNLEMGILRIKRKGSSGGHKGVQSIIDSLGTEDIPRLKMGIGMPQPGQDLVEYVLSDFTEEEKNMVEQMISQGATAVEIVLNQGIEKAMALINGKGKPV